MDKLWTPEFRVSFANVFEPKSYEGGKPKYSVVMLFDKAAIQADPEQLKLFKGLKAGLNQAAADKWGAKPQKKIKFPFRNGEEKDHLDGYHEGILFATASSMNRPGVVDQNVQPIIEVGDFYPGCYARATVNLYTWQMQTGQGVSFGLQNLQKTRDGEPFTAKTNPDEDFNAVDSPDNSETAEAASNDGKDLWD